MALIKAVLSGNASSGATWDGGIVPGSGDTAYSNTYTVTVDTSWTLGTVTNAAGAGITAGGTFALTDGVTLAANVIGGNGTTKAAVTFSLGVGLSATIIGDVSGTTGRAVDKAGLGTLTMVGNFVNGSTSNYFALSVTAGGSWSITGNATGIAQTCISLAHSGQVGEIIGNLSVSSASTLGCVSLAAGTLTVTGSATGNSSGVAAYAINTTGGTLTFNGPMTAGSLAPAVYASPAATCFFSGPFICDASTGVLAQFAARWFWIPSPTGTYLEVRTHDNSSTRSLYTADYTTALHMPAIGDVRESTVYGPAAELTGTLAVPPAGTVGLGVPVDASVGTAVWTQESIAAALSPLFAAYGS